MPVDTDPFFALTHAWWTWDHARVRGALCGAFLGHWLPIVEAASERMFGPGQRDRWAEILSAPEGLIRRDSRNLSKTARGDYDLSAQVMLGIASILSLPLDCLYPTVLQWVAGAASILGGTQVTVTAARAYAEFVLEAVARHACESAALETPRPPTCPTRVPAPVAAVARAIEPHLAAIDAEIRARRDQHE